MEAPQTLQGLLVGFILLAASFVFEKRIPLNVPKHLASAAHVTSNIWPLGVVLLGLEVLENGNQFPVALVLISVIPITYAIKFAVRRHRPGKMHMHIPIVNIPDYSFPSSHTALSFSIIPLLSRPEAQIIWGIVAVMIGASRVLGGQHHISDVVGGAVIGFTVSGVILLAF